MVKVCTGTTIVKITIANRNLFSLNLNLAKAYPAIEQEASCRSGLIIETDKVLKIEFGICIALITIGKFCKVKVLGIQTILGLVISDVGRNAMLII